MFFEYPYLLLLLVLPALVAALYIYREISQKRPHQVYLYTPRDVTVAPVQAYLQNALSRQLTK